MSVAVLFLVFNREESTMRVFEEIRKAKPPRLYLASDGPRADREGEADRVDKIRHAVVGAVDWDCEVRTLFRTANLGCRVAISSAIDWFFSQEEEGIILEDDCLPAPTFFRYCQEMLEKHRDDPRVMLVSGDNFVGDHWVPDASYYYTIYPHIWGWATWKRAWSRFELEFQESVRSEGRKILERTFPGRPEVRRHWARNFRIVGEGRADTWDSQWVFAIWRHGGICIAPRTNLISNIGFGDGATNAVDGSAALANLPVQDLDFPLRHPAGDHRRAEEIPDSWEHRNHFGIAAPSWWENLSDRILGRIAST